MFLLFNFLKKTIKKDEETFISSEQIVRFRIFAGSFKIRRPKGKTSLFKARFNTIGHVHRFLAEYA